MSLNSIIANLLVEKEAIETEIQLKGADLEQMRKTIKDIEALTEKSENISIAISRIQMNLDADVEKDQPSDSANSDPFGGI